MRYISYITETGPKEIQEILESTQISGGDVMPTLAQHFKEEFLQTIGPQIKKDAEKGAALKMLRKGFDLDTIIEITGLTESEILEISAQLKDH